MRAKITVLLLTISLGLFAQSNDVESLDERITEGWTTLDEGWNYQKGDDLNWAQPSYDDKQWKPVVAQDNGNINWVDTTSIAGKNEMVWFRKKIKIEASFKESIVFTVTELGASEIYLDGKLLNKFGEQSNLDSALHRKAWDDIFILPLVPGKEQLLAIRYATGDWDFPLYNGSRGIDFRLTTLSVLNSPDVTLNNRLALTRVGQKYFDISLGATSLISILFFTLFLFFPKEKINGYFALSTFFLSLFIISGSIETSMVSGTFWLNVFTFIVMFIGLLLMLFCIYRIFNRSLGFWFWTLCLLFLLALVSKLVYPISYFAFVVLLLYQFAIIILSVRALKTHRVAALIFLSCMGLIFIFFISNVILQAFGIDTTTYDVYFSGLSFMLLPLSIAIYLGYNFSQRSKSLALQLVAVKRLSDENTKILSEQKSTLEKEVTQRTSELNTSLENLKATQSQLIQSEKMASLGELTAGIAHEIQNPLNFVNNFSEVNTELIDEMEEEIKKGDYEEVMAIAKDIKDNQQKINHHGKRADAIVKGMLQHSRSSSAKKEPTNINKLADEYLRLAYYGLRAKDKSFNAELVTDFDESVGLVNVVPQDMGRVILNLITNAFYAVNEKAKANSEGYQPTVTVSSKRSPLLGGAGGGSQVVQIAISDNGNGIPKEIIDKIFQPFFTTKPTGQGTGLGLSMSYDIVTKGHGGELIAETKEGKGTEFIIHLPL